MFTRPRKLRKKLEVELRNAEKDFLNAVINDDFEAMMYFESEEVIKHKQRYLEGVVLKLEKCYTCVVV